MATRSDNIPSVPAIEWSQPVDPDIDDGGPTFWRDKMMWFGVHGIIPRALRTFGQTVGALIGVDMFRPDWSARWQEVLVTAGIAAMLSLLQSLGGTTHPTPAQPALAPSVPRLASRPPARGCGDSLKG